jgi:hypothetical protein
MVQRAGRNLVVPKPSSDRMTLRREWNEAILSMFRWAADLSITRRNRTKTHSYPLWRNKATAVQKAQSVPSLRDTSQAHRPVLNAGQEMSGANATWRGRVPFFDCLLLLYQLEIGKPVNFARIIFGLDATSYLCIRVNFAY